MIKNSTGIIKPPGEQIEITDERQKLINKFLDQNLECKNLNSNGEISFVKFADIISTKFVGFYFDAEWCKPGKEFLEQLKQVYKDSKSRAVNFEIVHVSYDTNEKTCLNNYRTNHPEWLLWPYQKNITNELAKFLRVKYLPCLIIISSNFKLITFTGRKEIIEKGFDAINYWDYVNKQNKKKKVMVKL